MTAMPSGVVGLIVTPSLPAFMFEKSADDSSEFVLSLNGCSVRAVSIRAFDSMRTTVAPMSASTRVPAGPAITHMKSRIFTPSSGRSVGAGVTGSGALGVRHGSLSTRSVSAPSAGAAGSRGNGVAEALIIGPGNLSPSTSSQKPRSTN